MAAGREHGVPMSAQSVGGMFGLYFRSEAPANFTQVMQCDSHRFNGFFHQMLEQGVYLAPSAYEAGFVSITHTPDDVAATARAASAALAASG